MPAARHFLRFIPGSLIFLFLAMGTAHAAEVLYVPDAYPTIQDGITAARDGDVVIVRDGNYSGAGNKNISFMGKAITVKSEKGPGRCTINGGMKATHAFQFQSAETSQAILEGFSITGFMRSAILCDGSSPTISNCIIRDNRDEDGAGIRCLNASSPEINQCALLDNSVRGLFAATKSAPKVFNSVIEKNDWCGIHAETGAVITVTNTVLAENWYGASAFADSKLVIKDSMILRNSYSGVLLDMATATGSLTNTVMMQNFAGIEAYSARLKVVNCTLAYNEYGIGAFHEGTAPSIVNSIIWGNTRKQVEGNAVVTYSNVQGGFAGDGNINAIPLFVNPNAFDLHLQGASPCVDAGNDAAAGLPAKDKNGRARKAGSAVDMGAYELDSALPPVQVVSARPTDPWGSEEGSTGLLRFIRSVATGSADTLPLHIFGSAKNGVDYARIPGSVTIEANQRFKLVLVTPTQDGLSEGTETAEFLIKNSTKYELAMPYAEVQIADSEQMPLTQR